MDDPDRKTSHRGLAPQIRKMAIRYPELTHSEIARRVGCDPSNVTGVLKTFLGKHSQEDLQEFQSNRAEVYDSLSLRLVTSLSDEKISKMPARDVFVSLGILHDKAALLRGQATGINVIALVDLVKAIRSEERQPVTIQAHSAPIPPAGE